MSLKYIKSERGTNILVDGEYMYHRECKKSEKALPKKAKKKAIT